uniref:DNA_mis_repair domain-containing protein n=1 Tax=Parastrongyloides trichosuri TaxID=131310 RepID=A0A0N5A2M6_PARTI
MGVIKKLPKEVINMIAAGEIITRPVSAVKELIENSMDAGATEISVTIVEGGLKLLQVQDNGCGIQKDDLEIVAERFTTSKLTSTEDLKKMQTYGFRGEALASISYVSNLSISSKTKDSKVAHVANFTSGKLNGDIKTCAGKNGTTITVRDLFYNLATRKKSYNNFNDEGKRIADIISRYAIENPNISFTFKNNSGKNSFRTHGKNNIKECVSSLLGTEIGNCLLEQSFIDERLHFECKLVFTKPKNTYTSTFIKDKVDNKKICHIFINKRLVDCTQLQNAVNNAFQVSEKVCHFISISLKIDPNRVDVNAHPAKKEVIFLNSEQIIQNICEYIKNYCKEESNTNVELNDNTGKLSQDFNNQSFEKEKKGMKVYDSEEEYVGEGVLNDSVYGIRNFDTSSQSSSNSLDISISKENPEEKSIPAVKKRKLTTDNNMTINKFLNTNDFVKAKEDDVTESQSFKKFYDFHKDRTNTQDQKISDFYKKVNDNDFRHSLISREVMHMSLDENSFLIEEKDDKNFEKSSLIRAFDLDSLGILEKEVYQDMDKELEVIFKKFSLIGFPKRIDDILIQHNTSMYKLNLQAVFNEVFYQLFLFSFGNFNIFSLESDDDDDLPYLDNLLKCYFKTTGVNVESEEVVRDINKGIEYLMKWKDMLWDYYSLLFEEKNGRTYLSAIPMICKDYVPHYEGLPHLIFNLIGNVDYKDELYCIKQICTILADFYTPKTKFCQPIPDEENVYCLNKSIEQWQGIIKEVLIPMIPKLSPSKKLRENDAVIKITDCHDLYKIFERC